MLYKCYMIKTNNLNKLALYIMTGHRIEAY